MTDLQSFTLMMASAQVVETSVNTNNSLSQDYTTNPDDHSNHNIDSPGFKPFTVILSKISEDFPKIIETPQNSFEPFPKLSKHFRSFSNTSEDYPKFLIILKTPERCFELFRKFLKVSRISTKIAKIVKNDQKRF